jgi:Spy/CpxP family protein refolding chaperone
MMKKLLLLTLLLLVAAFMLYAQKGDKPPMGKECDQCNNQQMMQKGDDNPEPMEMNKDMMKELNLTKEQQAKFEDLRLNHMKFMTTKQAEMKNLKMDKMVAMKNGDYDKAKLLNKQITDLELVIENAKVDHHMAMMKELTPEQQQKIKEMKPMMGGPMGKNKMMNRDKPDEEKGDRK